ncbi:hypothetical protein L6R52_33940 [Myxococcota bacterium]|nr:hypothetical protein [Myxococcota bacterium]
MILFAQAALALSLSTPAVVPDAVYGASVDVGGGVLPVSSTTSADIQTIALTPVVGFVLSDHTWSFRAEYRPRFYRRFPRDEGTREFLILNRFSAIHRHLLTPSTTLLGNVIGTFGEADYGRASLIAQASGIDQIPPNSVSVTNAVSGSLALSSVLPGGERLGGGVGIAYTELLTTAVGTSTLPPQLRLSAEGSWIKPLRPRDTLDSSGQIVWLELGDTLIRTANFESELQHEFSRRWRATGSLGVSGAWTTVPETQPPTTPGEEPVTTETNSVRVLPTVGTSVTYDRFLTQGTRLTTTPAIEVEGIVNAITRRYQPRLLATVGTTLSGPELSVGLSLVAYTSIEAGNRLAAPGGGDGVLGPPALEAGFSAAVPVTYRFDDELSLEISGRMSFLTPQIWTSWQPEEFGVRQLEAFLTITLAAEYSTQRTPAQ